MKSIMEEASSIIKAIEKGWAKAGSPKEFTVKILEEPQKNFFGLTTRSAKIGIFFDETIKKTEETPKQKFVAPSRSRQSVQEKERVQIKARPLDDLPSRPSEERPARPASVVWTQEMAEDVNNYLKETLAIISPKPITYSLQTQHFHLKIHFDQPIYEDKAREKQLFSSLATLMLQLLKNKYRRPLKGYKIVLLGG